MDGSIKAFTHGVHNLIDDEIIPVDASSNSKNWFTQDGKLKLIAGKYRIGAEGVVGSITGEIFGYKTDGSKIHWRKSGGAIQYLNGTTWTDVVTGLTATADYTFTNYSSLAGSFTFAFGVDGIYKFNNANPTSYCSMYDATKNFKGFAFIDKGRTILWNRNTDKTGLYGSYIDLQNSTVYTAVAGEATTSLSGTLAFKAGGATRNCFGVLITLTGTGEVYTDNYLGVLTGSLGGTGTINYITGAYTLSNAGVGTASYQWENSNAGGVTDFTHTATRLAHEGFVVRQDEGGDAILNVLIGVDGVYYSMKKQSVYSLSISADDLTISNQVYRKDIGIPFFRAAISTNKGIMFMNTANPDKPEMMVLQRNPVSQFVEPITLFSHFKFANYVYDDCSMETFERYILVSCKTQGASANDTVLLCDTSAKTVDISSYNVRTFAKSDGYLYAGSSITRSVYQLYNGFDDDGYSIDNFWEGRNELFGTERLKKEKKLRLMGSIDPTQSYSVYLETDNGGFSLVGTVLGSGSYVDKGSPQSIGTNFIGEASIGGSPATFIYPYFLEIKVKTAKFRNRKLKIVANGIGYVDINTIIDHDILLFEEKIPKRFRLKQNVSLNGATTDNATPSW